MLREKYGLKEEIAAQVGKIVHNCTISELLQLAELVDNKKEPKEWEFYWQNLVGPRSKEESEI